MMKCPECRKPIVVEKLSQTEYRIVCTSAACYYEEDFSYVPQVRQVNPMRRGSSRNRLTMA